jgi:hypothetical protein
VERLARLAAELVHLSRQQRRRDGDPEVWGPDGSTHASGAGRRGPPRELAGHGQLSGGPSPPGSAGGLTLHPYDVDVDWGTVGAVVLGAVVSLVSTVVLRRFEWRREQRVRIRLTELPAVRAEIIRLRIGEDDPIVEKGEIAERTAHALSAVASITSGKDRDHADAIVVEADKIKAVSDRYDWHGTPQPTLDDRRVHGPEQQLAVANFDEQTTAYEQWLERRLRFEWRPWVRGR